MYRIFVCGVIFASSMAFAEDRPTKKLIEFGWDEPDTAFLRKHVDEMEKSPFDGTVFHANFLGKDGKPGNFAWVAWGRRALTLEEMKPAIDDLSATRFGHFSHNFLRFNCTPADLDWFDDHEAVMANARIAGRIAREGRCQGILFDTEQYEKPLFTYRKQRDASSKSFDMYAEQARKRGKELIEAFQSEYPDLVVLLTFGSSLTKRDSKGGTVAPADQEYGLLDPLVKGLVAGSRGKTRIVDGYELSYGYRREEQFEAGMKLMKAEPNVGIGFGIWLDFDWAKNGWDVSDPSKNYFTPKGFETSVRMALERTDEFVWIYSETPRWWSPEGRSVKLPAVYEAALRRARE